MISVIRLCFIFAGFTWFGRLIMITPLPCAKSTRRRTFCYRLIRFLWTIVIVKFMLNSPSFSLVCDNRIKSVICFYCFTWLIIPLGGGGGFILLMVNRNFACRGSRAHFRLWNLPRTASWLPIIRWHSWLPIIRCYRLALQVDCLLFGVIGPSGTSKNKIISKTKFLT